MRPLCRRNPTKAHTTPRTSDETTLTRLIHLGLTLLAVVAGITGLFAGDYKRLPHLGFSLHKWLGISLSLFMLLRIWFGFYGSRVALFGQWLPYTRERVRMVVADGLHCCG